MNYLLSIHIIRWEEQMILLQRDISVKYKWIIICKYDAYRTLKFTFIFVHTSIYIYKSELIAVKSNRG